MEINPEIQKKAKQINKEVAERKTYLNECKKAGLCPKCGEKVVFRTGLTTSSYTKYTCKNCGRVCYY